MKSLYIYPDKETIQSMSVDDIKNISKRLTLKNFCFLQRIAMKLE